MFKLKSSFSPSWDQPQAIASILDGYNSWSKRMTLLGATGTWKTFTMANVIEGLQKPTIILSHNKTLAAQLATEFKYFFPDSAVHYFVSYFDYYQPESYLPEKWTYIEKEATINEEIQMYRLATMASLLSRQDVIVVASVSAIYGVWSKEYFDHNSLSFKVWEEYDFDEIKKKLLQMQYKPVQSKIEQWMFEISGDKIDIYVSTEQVMYRLFFSFNELEYIQKKDPLTFENVWESVAITIWPATQYLQNLEELEKILKDIETDLKERVAWFEERDMLVEAQRLKKKVSYDMRMIKETWFVNGIENYSPYFEKRLDGAPPNTLFDYFPEDCLVIIDESHMTIPQFWWMPKADKSRKEVLIDHWFRLPSAIHHRPLAFDELEVSLWWKKFDTSSQHKDLLWHLKPDAKTLFVTATPASYELDNSEEVVQQVIRPTGLLDPITYVYPKSWDYSSLITSIDTLAPSDKDLFESWYEKDTVEQF